MPRGGKVGNKGGTGRPPSPDKGRSLAFYFTQKQIDDLAANAAILGVKVSEYVKYKLFGIG